MDKLKIVGGSRLRGAVRVAGAKNAALPSLAAALLSEHPLRLTNLPQVRDVRTMVRVLEQLGATAERGEDWIEIAVERIASSEAPYDLVKTMRASVLVLGPLLARHGRARVSLPGGCAIGARPINYHIDGLRRMGAEVSVEHGYVEARVKRLRGAEIRFEQPTVTGTENLLMAATLAEGDTLLENCACEPEVVDLARLLRAMGANIAGEGSSRITVRGVPTLGGARHEVIPDRIEAGTYLVAGALIGDDVVVQGCRAEDLEAVLRQLGAAGVEVRREAAGLHVASPGRLLASDLSTAPHPGYPTDMQAQYMALMTQAHGLSRIEETIFERRFMHVGELHRMGANIAIEGQRCVVRGPTALTGAQVMATDLRASAGLVLAALVAEGVTVIDRIYHLDRGYETMESKLQALGAEVERIR